MARKFLKAKRLTISPSLEPSTIKGIQALQAVTQDPQLIHHQWLRHFMLCRQELNLQLDSSMELAWEVSVQRICINVCKTSHKQIRSLPIQMLNWNRPLKNKLLIKLLQHYKRWLISLLEWQLRNQVLL